MSLAKVLAAYDDNALEALASKGLVRRARRDLEAGLASVTERDDKSAVVLADGQNITLDGRGPASARCGCSADGVCRHILLAVMVLREAPRSPAPPGAAFDTPPKTPPGGGNAEAPSAPQTHSAATEVCAMTQAQLEKFAGAEWRDALSFAQSCEDHSINASGASCTIEMDGGAASVTFIQGQGLKGAAYKGPKTKKRLFAVAAAILLRQREGVKLEAGDATEEEAATGLSALFLDEAADVIERTTRMALQGSPLAAADMLFDLGVSARVEAAPRLTAQLRILARQARLAAVRDVHFESEDFLAGAARARALIEALKTRPEDVALTGSLRREYHPEPAFSIWFLGASRWRSETGARGLTFYGYDVDGRRWLSCTLARAAGQDPTFDPASAYRAPIWKSDTPTNLMGRCLHFPAPLLASDGAIAPTLPQPPSAKDSSSGRAVLEAAGAIIDTWRMLKADLGVRCGFGLSRKTAALPALILPARFGGLAFDEFRQRFELSVYDRMGDMITLSLDADSDALARRLQDEAGKYPLLLIEASAESDRAVFRPVALLSEQREMLSVINMDLDHWQRSKLSLPRLNLLPMIRGKAFDPQAGRPDPVHEVTQRALEAAAAIASGMIPQDLDGLAKSANALGLVTLERTLKTESLGTSGALRCAYIASEIQASLTWTSAS
jgi:hypothetical protein